MNKILTFLTFTLILSLPAFSQTDILLGDAFSDGLEKYIHFGKIDTIIETNFKAKEINGEISRGNEDYGKAKTVVIFDNKENVVELSVYISNDKKGNTYRYELDKKGRLIKRTVLNSELDTVHKIIINFQTKALIETSFYFEGQANPTTKWLFEFDKKDRIVTEKKSFPNDNKVYTTYELGKNNKKIKKVNDTYLWNYKYNSKEKLTEEEEYTVLQIDDGDPIRPVYKNIYTYDKYLNIIGIQKILYSTEKYIKYEYTSDKKNNWTKRIEFEDDRPKLITERKIVYKK